MAGQMIKQPADAVMGMEPSQASDFEDIQDKLKFPKRNRKAPGPNF